MHIPTLTIFVESGRRVVGEEEGVRDIVRSHQFVDGLVPLALRYTRSCVEAFQPFVDCIRMSTVA